MENSIIFQVIWILLVILEVGLYYKLLFGTVIEKKLMGRIDTAFMWVNVVCLSILLLVKQKYMFFQRSTFLAVLVVIIICTWLMWRRDFLLLIAAACSYYSFTALLDSLFLFLQAAFVESEKNAIIYATEINVESMMLYAGIVSRICMLFLVLVYQRILEHNVTYATFVSMGVGKSNVRSSMIAFLTSIVIACIMAVLLLKNKSIEKENDFIKINPEIYTGNRILDLILGQKRMKAEQNGIAFELQAMPLAKLPFQDREICSLFGNLLDNAVEACDRADGKKQILVKIEKQKKLFFVEIANTIKEIPVKEGKSFFTAKADKENHGYGLKSVRRIVEEYEGVISYEIKENEFVVTLTFFDVG